MGPETTIRMGEKLTSLVVEGGHRLAGRVDVEGNKNSALPLLAACLLTEEPCVLNNVPRIQDVQVMADLLAGLGADLSGVGTSTLRVRCARVVGEEPDRRLVGRLRGSVLLCGPLLARRGRVHLAPPGGDFPARRTLSVHLQALEAMGAAYETVLADQDRLMLMLKCWASCDDPEICEGVPPNRAAKKPTNIAP